MCPICISQGFHSLYHQVVFLDICLIHNVKLIDRCPSCNNPIPYTFHANPYLFGFKCGCGYNFLKNKNHNEIFYISWKRNDALQNYIGNTSKKIVYHYSTFSAEEGKWLFDYKKLNSIIFNRIEGNIDIKVNAVNHAVFNYYKKEKVEPHILYFKYKKIIRESYCSFFKSIARHIRNTNKKVLKRNIKLLKSKRNEFYYFEALRKQFGDRIRKPNIYVPAYAYLMWRRDIEGLQEYSNVHKPISNKKYKYVLSPMLAQIEESDFFRYFNEELYTYCKNMYTNNPSDFLHVLEYIMAHMFLSHYKNWVSYAQIIMQDVQSINMKETLNYDLPFFIVTYPKNDDSRTIEVQIWRNKD